MQRIDHQDRGRIRGAIALLAQDLRPPGASRLQGRDGYRVRVDRIIYTIDDAVLLVMVVTLGHPSHVYGR